MKNAKIHDALDASDSNPEIVKNKFHRNTTLYTLTLTTHP
jgi:hypothetical protein